MNHSLQQDWQKYEAMIACSVLEVEGLFREWICTECSYLVRLMSKNHIAWWSVFSNLIETGTNFKVL